ncbi:MAG: class I SAM-dependent methyltransferase [Rhodobacteraceae bacterium]|nr:class I SAM-dependent methyltransferase [Paracoccaceae bacterium]
MHIYDAAAARHYAAYRPPLHQLILAEALGRARGRIGLDVGCGTGRSAVALAEYCDSVIAIDPSRAMLDAAVPHHQVEYRRGSGDDLPVEAGAVDLVTFAGVLPYLDTAAVLEELRRVCAPNAHVLVYDFEVILADVMAVLSLSFEQEPAPYDHASNLQGQQGVSTLHKEARQISFPLTEVQAAHVLLSNKMRSQLLSKMFSASDPFDPVVKALRASGWSGALSARIFYTLHSLDS